MPLNRSLYRGLVGAVLVAFLAISGPGIGAVHSAAAQVQPQTARHADNLTDFTTPDHLAIVQAAYENLPALLAVQYENHQLASPNAEHITGGSSVWVWPPSGWFCHVFKWTCDDNPPYLLNAAKSVPAIDAGTPLSGKMGEAARLLPTVNKKSQSLTKPEQHEIVIVMNKLVINHASFDQLSQTLDAEAAANTQVRLNGGFAVAKAILKDGQSTIYNPSWLAATQGSHWGTTPQVVAKIRWWKLALAGVAGAIAGSLSGDGGSVVGGIGASVGTLAL